MTPEQAVVVAQLMNYWDLVEIYPVEQMQHVNCLKLLTSTGWLISVETPHNLDRLEDLQVLGLEPPGFPGWRYYRAGSTLTKPIQGDWHEWGDDWASCQWNDILRATGGKLS